ncbi:MAG: MMPL family transporter [Candidatus Competibacteraceae bacterium]
MKQESISQQFVSRFCWLLIDNPWKSLLLVIVLAALTAAGMRWLTPDFTYRGYFKPTDPLRVQVEELQRRFGNDDAVVLLVHSPSGVFDRETANLLLDLTKRMWQVPEVIRVESLSNYRWVHAAGDDIVVEPLIPDKVPLTDEILKERKAVALNHEVIPGFLVSKDAKTALVIGYVKPSLEKSADPQPVVQAVRKIITEVAGGDHVFHILGRVAVETGFKESMQQDMRSLVPVVLASTVILLFLCFRTAGGVVLPLGVLFLSILMTFGLAGWLGMKITNVTAAMPQFMIGIGIADSIHLLTSFYAARRRGEDRRQAAYYSLSMNFGATFLTSICIAIGFLSFASSEIMSLSWLGLMVGLGTMVAWLLTYLLLGPMLVLFPNRTKMDETAPLADEASPRAERFTAFLYKVRLPILIVFGIVAVATTIIASDNQINANPFKYFAKGYWLRAGNDFAEQHLGGVQGMEIVIDSGAAEGIKEPEFLHRVDAYQNWINEQPGVTRTVSVIDIIKQVNRALHGGEAAAYVLPNSREEIAQSLFLYTLNLPQGMDINDRMTLDNDSLRISVRWTLYETAAATAAAARFREKATTMGLHAVTTGKVLLYQNMNGHVVTSFLTSGTIASLLISLLMTLYLRSWRLGLLAMIPNIMPVSIGYAILNLMGQPLDVGTIVITSVCLGITVDDTIHFMSHFESWRRAGFSTQEAISRVFSHITPALMTGTLILVIAFGAFAFATFVPNRNFGLLTAVILTIGLGTEVVLTPILLMLVYGERSKALEMTPEQASVTAY